MLWKLRKDLGERAMSRPRLYLDQRYWNDLCDGFLGVNDPALSRLGLLESAVSDGCLVCPGGALALSELAEQRVPAKRDATAEVIDLLCGGVALLAPPDRLFLEVLRFVQACPASSPFPVAPADEVWTAPAFVYGHEGVPTLPEDLPGADQLNATLMEEYAAFGYRDIVRSGGLSPFAFKMKSAASLNETKAAARERFKTFRDLYLAEVRGVLDLAVSELGDTINYLAAKAGIDVAEVSPDRPLEAGRALAQVLHAAFSQQDLGLQVPSVHIPATLFARVQWDAPRQYDPNDFADFLHATAALPYHSAFATERSLTALLRESGLAAKFGCTILSDWDAVEEWVVGVACAS